MLVLYEGGGAKIAMRMFTLWVGRQLVLVVVVYNKC